MGQDRARERLIDRAVERLVEGLFPPLPQVLTHAIEDDDRVVQRITEHGEQARHNGERDLEVHQLQERDRREDVVARCYNCRRGESPLEANREVDECNQEREKYRDDRAPL